MGLPGSKRYGEYLDAKNDDLRMAVSDADRFLKQNPHLLGHDFYRRERSMPQVSIAEAGRLRDRIQAAVRGRLSVGGKMPDLMRRANLALEDLGIIKNAPIHAELFTYYKVLSAGQFLPQISDDSQALRLMGYVAMRSALVLRGFGDNPYSNGDLGEHLNERAPMIPIVHRGRRIEKAVNDALVVFVGVSRKIASLVPEANLGWVMEGYSQSDLRGESMPENRDPRQHKNNMEGVVRRQYVVDEVVRDEANRISQSWGRVYMPPHSLTLVSEVATHQGLQGGKLPKFFDGKVRFGDFDVSRKPEDISLGEVEYCAESIKSQVKSAAPLILAAVSRELSHIRDPGRQKVSVLVRGGRKGLNPSDLYRF